MPIRINAGINKKGRKKEYIIPSEIHGPRGEVYKEWEIKNSYRDSRPVKLFDHNGNHIGKENSGLIYDSRGKLVNGIVIEGFTKSDILKDIAKHRRTQRKLKWVDRRTRRAGEILTEISKLKKGMEEEAIMLLVKDPFYKVGFFRREITIPKNATVLQIYEAAQDYFFKKFKEMNNQRKQEHADGARSILKFAKDLFR